MTVNNFSIKQHSGFTLVEMAIVLVIFGLVLSSLLLPLQAQRDLAFIAQTNATLDNAKQALLGFAQRNGRLPCPATNLGTATFPDDTGTANPNGSGACNQLVGFLPAATLGLQPTDSQGFALDGWNNRIRYSVTNANANAFTTNNALNTLGISTLTPNLRLCVSSTPANCTNDINLTNEAVAVIYSTGASGRLAAGGADENANLDNNNVFISHDSRENDANGEFDHITTWVSPYVLYNAMIQAGQLR